MGDFREKLSITRVEKSDTDLINDDGSDTTGDEQNSNTQDPPECF